jgi:hypothetical protein
VPHCEISDSLLARAGRKPLDLEIIERIYEAAWAQFEARRPFRNTEADDERQETLRKQVMKIASEGKVEFDTVYEKVIADMLEPPPTITQLEGMGPQHRD